MTLQNCTTGDPANEKDVSLSTDIGQLEIAKVADAEQKAFGGFFVQEWGFVTLVLTSVAEYLFKKIFYYVIVPEILTSK